MMNIQSLVQELDEAVMYADLTGAVQRFFDDDVEIRFRDRSMKGKANKLKALSDFMDTVQYIKKIEIHRQVARENSSWSLFTFDFIQKNGHRMVWYEIIKRDWKDGKVICEEYFTKPDEEMIADIFKKQKAKPSKKAKKRRAKRKSKSPTKILDTSSELRSIKGIGPKVESLLNAAGIHTFSDLAKAEKRKITEILDEAGPRYKNYDPTEWLKTAKKRSTAT